MSTTYLIADSGSTKTAWVLTDGHTRKDIESMGINPVRDDEATIAAAVPDVEGEVQEVYFYGAGCIAPYAQTVEHVLQQRFPQATIHVESDLLGAAHALCGHHEGIACILGTGSNSCLYDGQRIVVNVSPLGWILGDEGSGAVLGRRLVGDVLKEQFSPTLCQAFAEETGLTRTHIINKVYREPMPNRFLASLVPFLVKHRGDSEVHEFLVEEFCRFLQRNVKSYGRRDLPVSFVGGIAYGFADEVREALQREGFEAGTILQRPIDRMVNFILSDNQK